jgi:peptide/nickel transport system ATP-binding protein
MTSSARAGETVMSPPPAPRPAQARLEVSGLEVRLAASAADVVSEVSFSLQAGEVLGLVGESGSGKTTVALALLGHARRGLAITAGQVRVQGTDLLQLGPSQLREMRGRTVAYVPQDPAAALNPALRVGGQLEEALTVHRGVTSDVPGRLAEVLAEARLDVGAELLRRYPHQLSGGQQQRVALAMAFSCRPSLIVLDEPTTGMDVTTQRHVLDTVRSLCQSYGVAAVYVSHDLAVVAELVSQVAVMYAGRVVELGTTSDVFRRPAHPYTRGLLAAVPSPDRAEILAGIDGQPPRPGNRPEGCSFAPRCGYAVSACSAGPPPPVLTGSRVVRCIRAATIEAAAPRRTPVRPLAAARPVPLLSVRGLTAHYGPVPVLSAVDFDLSPETCLAVVGESGSGKTTLARCIVGLHSTWTGDLTFDGAPMAAGTRRRSKTQLRRIQYIFQNPYTSLNPRKTVGQIISQQLEHFTRLPFQQRSARIRQVLADVALEADIASRYPDQLSGGERQRVALARALIVGPDLLVCDEVTSALDVSVQAVIIELLRRLQADQSLAMIFITHNLALVRSVAQTAVVLQAGRIVEAGPVGDVLERPAHRYTARLMHDIPRLAVAATPDLSRMSSRALAHVGGASLSRLALRSRRGRPVRSAGQMAERSCGVGNPRPHRGRGARVALGAAASGLRQARGPAGCRAIRAVLQASLGGARTARQRARRRVRGRSGQPAAAAPGDLAHRGRQRHADAGAPCAAGRGPRDMRPDGAGPLAGCRGTGRPGRRGDLPSRAV